ncbi:uncharacterized protein LOC144332783 [Macaca mulatta]
MDGLKVQEVWRDFPSVLSLGFTVKQLNIHQIHDEDMQLIWDALEGVKNEPPEPIQSLTDAILRAQEDAPLQPAPPSRLSRLSSFFQKASCATGTPRKKYIFN